MKFTNKGYDVVKAFAQIILPALGALYSAVAGIWGLPDAEKVVGTIVAIDTFLGVILAIASSGYKPPADGKLIIDQTDPNKDVHTLHLDTPVEDLPSKKVIKLNVESVKLNLRAMPNG